MTKSIPDPDQSQNLIERSLHEPLKDFVNIHPQLTEQSYLMSKNALSPLQTDRQGVSHYLRNFVGRGNDALLYDVAFICRTQILLTSSVTHS